MRLQETGFLFEPIDKILLRGRYYMTFYFSTSRFQRRGPVFRGMCEITRKQRKAGNITNKGTTSPFQNKACLHPPINLSEGLP